METLNRQETEDLIIDLYYNKKKTFREIQKIVRKSPRDISAVLNRVEPERSSVSISSQAYKLFSEDKTPIQVAITLNLREPDARQFYLEYWNLQHLYNLYQIYQEIKTNIGYFVNLYKSAVGAGFNVPQVIRFLNIANNELPTVENRIHNLRREEVSLNYRYQNAAKALQDLSNELSNEYKRLEQYRVFCKRQEQEIKRISLQKTALQEYVEYFQKNNDVYLKIKDTIKREVKSVLTNPRQLLGIALVSLIESSRIDPRKFYALCYNKDITTERTSSARVSSTIDDDQYDYASSSMNEQLLPLDYGTSDESFEKMLLDESEKLYNRIIDDITSKAINSANGNNTWSFQPERRSPPVKRDSLHKLFTFTYREEGGQNFIYSEIGDEEEDQNS